MLMSSNRKDGEQKIILKYEPTQDGIMAWMEFLKDYDNKGSEEVRASKLESLVSIKYNHKHPGGFLKYIDTLQANLNELAILLPSQYSEDRKQRTLYQNIKEVKTLTHLIQSCKDRNLTYQEAATYLRIHGAELDQEEQESRKTNQVEQEVEKTYLSYDETREIFTSMVEVHGARRAFQVLNRAPKFREQLSIHPKIWKRLSEEIQNEIKKVRDSVREEGRSKQSKNSPPKSLPPQYGLNKSTNNTTKENDGAERLAAMI